jgi:hypothetical protein
VITHVACVLAGIALAVPAHLHGRRRQRAAWRKQRDVARNCRALGLPTPAEGTRARHRRDDGTLAYLRAMWRAPRRRPQPDPDATHVIRPVTSEGVLLDRDDHPFWHPDRSSA